MMKISDRFLDNLLASTRLNTNTVSGLNTGDVGPVKIPGVTLAGLAEHLELNIESDAADSGFARPSILAHISGFLNNVHTALIAIDSDKTIGTTMNYRELPRQVKEDFAEWQGLISLVALNGVYTMSGLQLRMVEEKLDGRNILDRTILREMQADAAYCSAVSEESGFLSGKLFYLYQNDRAIALFHPQYGLCPLSTYAATDIGDAVPWYDPKLGTENAHKGWKSIVDWDGDGKKPTPFLANFCMDRVSWWVRGFGLLDYAECLDAAMGATNVGGKRTPAYPNEKMFCKNDCFLIADTINDLWSNKGSSFSRALYLYEDGRPLTLPNMFLDRLMIQYVDEQKNNCCVYVDEQGQNRSVCFEKAPDFLSSFAPVLPMTREAAEILRLCTIRSLRFLPECVSGILRAVRVELTLCNRDNEEFTLSKTYEQAQMYQTSLSHLMVWPFVDMPKESSWKAYYATWASDPKGSRDSLYLDADKRMPKADFSGYIFEKDTEAYAMNRYGDTEKWRVVRSDSLFRHAILRCTVDGSDIDAGVILFPIPEKKFDPTDPIVAQPINLAIDFGTTSTVCALSGIPGIGSIQDLPYADYTRCVTCYDEKEKQNMEQQRWMGAVPAGGSYSGKIFSIAQLFQRSGRPDITQYAQADQQQLYLDGRMLLLSSFFSDYTLALGSGNDALKEQKFTNDMKFSAEPDPVNTHAAMLFLSSIYTYATLYVLSLGQVPRFHMFVSYPNEITRSALKSNWVGVKTILGRVMEDALLPDLSRITYYKEAAAASAYYAANKATVTHANELISLDIGGGTTDISLTKKSAGKGSSLSVRYAGREIMVDSLIEYFRHWYNDTEDSDKAFTGFKKLWNDNDETNGLIRSMLQLLHSVPAGEVRTEEMLKGKLRNSTVRINTELLLADGLQIGTVDSKPEYNFLRELIALKFMMVMEVTAQFVSNHLDMWNLDKNTVSERQFNFHIKVSGTSAQLLQYIFDVDNLGILTNVRSGVKNPRPLMTIFRNQFAAAIAEKLGLPVKDVYEHIALTLYVDQNVQKKTEVCYGLLSLAGSSAAEATDDDTDTAEDSGIIGSLSTESDAPISGAAVLTDGILEEEEPEEEEELNDVDAIADRMREFSPDAFKGYILGNQGGSPGLLALLNFYETKYFSKGLIAPVGLGSVKNLSQLLDQKQYESSFDFYRNAVAENMAQYMVDQEQSPYFDVLMNTYLLDEHINSILAEIQLHDLR